MVLRLAFIALVVVPFALVGLPFQLVLLRFAPRAWGVLPGLFFRLLAFALGLKVTVHGRPATDVPVLLVANHISWLDIVAIASVIPVRFVAKSDVANWALVGFFARLQKTIFVDRTRRTDTGRTARAMGDALAAGDPVLLFAEGTSGIGTHVLPFKSALIGAAEKAMGDAGSQEVVIQPMAIAYTAISGLPLSRHERPRIAWVGNMGLGDNLWHILASGPKSVTIAFCSPMPANGARKTVSSRAEHQVRAMLVALNRGQALPSEGVYCKGAQ
ncbi:lysophospholipid acyltransferase family protein [Pelagibacterium limicola]|uniref:lysophospholipid acyltransferase family protein n=1 Tax=Pelagibacterium limicola TaxID=2791022 RepID=UPI0018AF82CB|nr:lysophospholipid acyltransferase family protein [Pelagibacterium limicola]